MGLIDSFWGTERDNPRGKRSRHTTARASRGGHPEKWVTRTSVKAPVEHGEFKPVVAPENERWSTRTSIEAPRGQKVEYGTFTPTAAAAPTGAWDWAKHNKYKAAGGVAAGAALIAYLAKPAQATVVTPAVVQVTPSTGDSDLGKALGVGLFAALAFGVAMAASDDQ